MLKAIVDHIALDTLYMHIFIAGSAYLLVLFSIGQNLSLRMRYSLSQYE